MTTTTTQQPADAASQMLRVFIRGLYDLRPHLKVTDAEWHIALCALFSIWKQQQNASRQRPLPAESDSEKHNQRCSG